MEKVGEMALQTGLILEWPQDGGTKLPVTVIVPCEIVKIPGVYFDDNGDTVETFDEKRIPLLTSQEIEKLKKEANTKAEVENEAAWKEYYKDYVETRIEDDPEVMKLIRGF